MSPIRLLRIAAALSAARLCAAQTAPPVPSTLAVFARSSGSQKQDDDYTAKIREFTTAPYFLTELVDHLPASDRVPTPLKTLGHISGHEGRLTYSADVNRYMRSLEKATRRVRVFSMGQSEDGREMILVAVSEKGNLDRLDRYKETTARLADPRKTTDSEAEKLIRGGKAIYWATGAMHSPETGSPEMLMELAYRLAVEETPFVRDIRKNVITLITPVLETDGRDRVLDVIHNRKRSPGLTPVYWGKYVAHDNNRDGMSLALALTRNVMKAFLEYHPTVLHDLHESVPFLYTSTGTGPYNPWLDPIVINEWHQLAYYEINEMTKRGVPGVWTHGYYDGWAPNYMFFLANGHNSIGRFYETYGGGDPVTQDRTVGPQSNRDWFRPNPPLHRVKWSLRNNVNYQQSALLLALHYTAEHKDEMLNNFYLKSKRAVAKAATEGPAAYVLPGDEKRKGNQAELIHLLRLHGIEVQQTTAPVTTEQGSFPPGSYVVRMDQPYSRMADMLLDTDYYNVNDPNPYDDTGWTLGPLKNVKTVRVTDAKVLQAAMAPIKIRDSDDLNVSHPISPGSAKGPGWGYVVRSSGDAALLGFCAHLGDVPTEIAEEDFVVDGVACGRGSVFVRAEQVVNASAVDRQIIVLGAASGAGADIVWGTLPPNVKSRPLAFPRIALLHTWQSTQNEGWWRIGFDQWKVPYDYISVHTVRDTENLRSKYDVIVFSPSFGNGAALQAGISGSQPIPWKKTPETPNLGGPDSSDDIRGGLGQSGVDHLKRFVEEGGLLITAQNTATAAIDWGLAKGVSVIRNADLRAQGSVLNAIITDSTSPVTLGYDGTLAVYYNNGPIFKLEGEPEPTIPESTRTGRTLGSNAVPRPSGRGTLTDPDIVQARPASATTQQADDTTTRPTTDPRVLIQTTTSGPMDIKNLRTDRPRVLLRFADESHLLVSGMLAGGSALAHRAAVIDAPLGKGHVLLFAINPFWRSQTQGSYPLVFNASLHFDHLGEGR